MAVNGVFHIFMITICGVMIFIVTVCNRGFLLAGCRVNSDS